MDTSKRGNTRLTNIRSYKASDIVRTHEAQGAYGLGRMVMTRALAIAPGPPLLLRYGLKHRWATQWPSPPAQPEVSYSMKFSEIDSGFFARVAGVALLYFVAAIVGLQFAVVGSTVTLVWPSSGIALVVVIALG